MRKYLFGLICIAFIFGSASTFHIQDPVESAKESAPMQKEKIERVKLAMLTMQRMSWEQGTAAQALLEMGETDLVILMAKEAHLRRLKDGRAGVVTRSGYAVNDPAANGEALLYAAELTGDSTLKKTAYDMIGYLLHEAERSKDGVLSHISPEIRIMSDAMYMTPPFLAVAGYYKEAIEQVEGIRKYLWNSETKLFSHVWSEKLNDFEREDFWGVGNGWCAAGMARVIDLLPENFAEDKERLIKYVTDLLDGCLIYLRDDGLFHDVIDNPETFVETNLSQMLAYTIYRGVKAGWLNSNYLQYANKMREAANNKVDKYGLVQGVCGAPDFDHSGVATEGQAFFLLMETAAMKLTKQF